MQGKTLKTKLTKKRPRILERNVGTLHRDDTTLVFEAGNKALTSQRMNIEVSLTSW